MSGVLSVSVYHDESSHAHRYYIHLRQWVAFSLYLSTTMNLLTPTGIISIFTNEWRSLCICLPRRIFSHSQVLYPSSPMSGVLSVSVYHDESSHTHRYYIHLRQWVAFSLYLSITKNLLTLTGIISIFTNEWHSLCICLPRRIFSLFGVLHLHQSCCFSLSLRSINRRSHLHE